MQPIKYGSTILDPACFPLLYPSATQGLIYIPENERPNNVFLVLY